MRPDHERKNLPLFGAVEPRLPSAKPAAHIVRVVRFQIASIGPPARAAIMGFVAGAVFWHLVGFWSFIDRIIFAGPITEARAPATAPLPGNAIETGSLQRFESLNRPTGGIKTSAGCSVLVRERSTGLTRESACTKPIHPLREKPASPRRALDAHRAGIVDPTLITALPLSAFDH